MSFDKKLTSNYLQRLTKANSESARKELFLQYLTNTFDKSREMQDLIARMSGGAETTIKANITRKGHSVSGRADTLTDTLIIEWKKNLARDRDDARQQLAKYYTGKWASGERYGYTLLATDGVLWTEYVPTLEICTETGDIIATAELREVRSFELNEKTLNDFPFFLDQLLLRDTSRPATLANIEEAFGDSSKAYFNSLAALTALASKHKNTPEFEVAYDQWQRLLTIAYGTFEDTTHVFLVHSYLSVFAKFLAFAVLTRSKDIPSEQIPRILSGDAFEAMNVQGFVESDFFAWTAKEQFRMALAPMFREIALSLSSFTFENVNEDILKGVYENLIDSSSKEALGQHYTPDWLCDAITDRLSITVQDKVLDPACGSGSFLRSAIQAMVSSTPNATASQIAGKVVGIDVHPLSVQLAKATMLLALGGRLKSAKEPIRLQVYLANSLLVPDGSADIFGGTFTVQVDGRKHKLDMRSLPDSKTFDAYVSFAAQMVERTKADDPYDRNRFVELASGNFAALSDEFGNQLHELYVSMHRALSEGRDSIWSFILQNSYKPIFLKGTFTKVLANPPWLTYADFADADYQRLLKELSDEYAVTPSKSNMPHLEIAAIFAAHIANYYLKPGGVAGLVLPRSFLSADHHVATREGTVKGMALREIWDLEGVSPLFPVPSCVLIAMATGKNSGASQYSQLVGRSLEARLPRSQLSAAAAMPYLKTRKTIWHFAELRAGKKRRTAFSEKPLDHLRGPTNYAKAFRQGATILPRSLLYVDSTDHNSLPDDIPSRTVHVRSSQEARDGAKQPWREIDEESFVDGAQLYTTTLARCVLPHAFVDPPLAFVPVKTTLNVEGHYSRRMLSADDMLADGHKRSAAWMDQAERIYSKRASSKAKARMPSICDRIDFNSLLRAQAFRADDHLVLYIAAGKNACAAVVSPDAFQLPFLIDHTTYWAAFRDPQEAHFVSAMINSNYANQCIKDFQSRGLFGQRHVHTLILSIPWPKFSAKDKEHESLTRLATNLASSVSQYAKLQKGPTNSPHELGRRRTDISRKFAPELKELSDRVENISRSFSMRTTEGRSKASQTRIRETDKGRLVSKR